MATTPQFPGTPIVGQVVLTSGNTSGTLYTCSNENGAYIEKLIVYASESKTLQVKLTKSSTTTVLYSMTSSSGEYKMDFAIPNGASVSVEVTTTPSGSIYVTLFGGEY